MSNEEIIETMSKPISASRVSQYRQIYIIATGKPFRGCLCGSGMENLTRVCKSYANNLKLKQQQNDTQTQQS